MRLSRSLSALLLGCFFVLSGTVPVAAHATSYEDSDPNDGEHNQLDLVSVTQKHPGVAITYKIEMKEAFSDADLRSPENEHYSLRFYVSTDEDEQAERWIVVDTKTKNGDLTPFVRVIRGGTRPQPSSDDDDFAGAGVIRRIDDRTIKIRVRGRLLKQGLDAFRWNLLARGSYDEGNTGVIYDDYIPTNGVAVAHTNDGE